MSGDNIAVIATSAEAPPPNPLNSATSSGIEVSGTLRAAAAPMAAPTTTPARINSNLTMC